MNRIKGADGIRALACLLVIGHHLVLRFGFATQGAGWQEIAFFLLNGASGVSIFFVLSGLLLAYPFWHAYLHAQALPDWREYALRRAGRIIPAFYVALWVSFAVEHYLLTPAYPWVRLFSAMTFTSSFHYITFFPTEINGPLWSIGFEVVSYVLLPLGMLGLFRWVKSRKALPALGYWAILWVLVLCVHRFLLTHAAPDALGQGWEYGIIGGAKYWVPHYNPIGLFAHFALGVVGAGVIAGLARRGVSRTLPFDILAGAGLLGALVLLWVTRNAAPFSMSWLSQPYYFPYFPALITATLVAAHFGKWAPTLLDNRFFRFTAKVSFGLYIWHFLLIEVLRRAIPANQTVWAVSPLSRAWLLSALILVLSYGIATLSFYVIEQPALNWIRRMIARRQTQAPQAIEMANSDAITPLPQHTPWFKTRYVWLLGLLMGAGIGITIGLYTARPASALWTEQARLNLTQQYVKAGRAAAAKGDWVRTQLYFEAAQTARNGGAHPLPPSWPLAYPLTSFIQAQATQGEAIQAQFRLVEQAVIAYSLAEQGNTPAADKIYAELSAAYVGHTKETLSELAYRALTAKQFSSNGVFFTVLPSGEMVVAEQRYR